MALPFLNKKKDAGIASSIIEQQNRGNATPEPEAELEEYTLEDCAHDILDAIQDDNARALSFALKEAFRQLESKPHEEAEHKPSPHTFEAQNIKAGQE